MDDEVPRRQLSRYARVAFGSLAVLVSKALVSRDLYQAFLGSSSTSRLSGIHQAPQLLQGAEQGLPVFPQAQARGAPSGAASGACGKSWAGALLILGAATALQSRDESRATMHGSHDRRTFRGKLHRGSYGKVRIRKNKMRRIQAIKAGTFDPDAVVQRGQPEPEHVFDIPNLLNNPLVHYKPHVREELEEKFEREKEEYRANWKSLMGIKGKQWAFKNWTPPGMDKASEVVEQPA